MIRAVMAAIILATVAFAISARAHDPDGKWNDWFGRQKNVRGASCCALSHAHFVRDEDWRNGGKHYQVRINDRWHDVEDWQMLQPAAPNPTGKAILWYNDIGGNLLIYCFTPSRET
jgi:hypothetical protein